MKKFISLGLIFSAFSLPAAFADEAFDLSDLIPAESLDQILNDEANVAADETANTAEMNTNESPEYDRHPGRPGHRPGRPGYPGYPGNPGHPGYPGGGHHNRVVCFAKNHWGQTFRGDGYRTWEAQREAMERCYRTSRRCYEMGCRRG